jgi:dolichol-phosphate mannosyltransferase
VGTLPLGWIVQTPFPYRRAARFAGATKYPSKKMLTLALDGILSFSMVPLRLLTIVGGLTAVPSVAGILACENNLGYTKRCI